MILDESSVFMDAQAETTAATNLSDNVVDLGTGSETDPGAGEPIYLVITCDVTPTSAGSATVQFKLASDAAAAISTTTSSIHYQSGVIDFDDLVAGDTVAMVAIPDGGIVPYERFLGVLWTIGTADLTAGAFSAHLTKDPRRIAFPADAVN